MIANRREIADSNIWALCARAVTEATSESAATKGSMKTVVFRMRMPLHQKAGDDAYAVNAIRLFFCARAGEVPGCVPVAVHGI